MSTPNKIGPILLWGLPGAGKSTIAHAICERFQCVLFETDAIESVLPIEGANERYHLAFDVIMSLVRLNRACLGSIVLTGALPTNAHWKKFSSATSGAGQDVTVFFVDTPQSVAHKRVIHRDGLTDREAIASCKDNIEEVYRLYQTQPERITISHRLDGCASLKSQIDEVMRVVS